MRCVCYSPSCPLCLAHLREAREHGARMTMCLREIKPGSMSVATLDALLDLKRAAIAELERAGKEPRK